MDDTKAAPEAHASASHTMLGSEPGSSRAQTAGGATHTRWNDPGPSQPSVSDDQSEPLSVAQLKLMGRSRIRRHAIPCLVRYGKEQCDARLTTVTNLERHLLRTHAQRARAQLQAEQPVPDIKWGTRRIDWHTIEELEEELHNHAQLEAESYCVLKDCTSPQIVKPVSHYKNHTIHPPQPWTAADLYPVDRPSRPPSRLELAPLPPPLPPYLLSCPTIQPYTPGGPGPHVSDIPLLRGRPREERYLPLRDPDAPFHPGGSGLPHPHRMSLSSDIFPLVGDDDDDLEPSIPGGSQPRSQSVVGTQSVPGTPRSKRTLARSASILAIPPSPTASLAALRPPSAATSTALPKIEEAPRRKISGQPQKKLVKTTTPLRVRPLRPGEEDPIPTAATPGRGLRVVPRTLTVREIPNPLQYIHGVRKQQAEREQAREAAYKQRREASESGVRAAGDGKRSRTSSSGQEGRAYKAGSAGPKWASVQAPVKRPRPSLEQLESAGDLYARKRSGKPIGKEYWTALADFKEATRVFMRQVELEGGWRD